MPQLPPGLSPETLKNNPDLASQLRQRLQGSGLTPDQVRARLRATGYPEDMLDSYLLGADTTRRVTPAPNTLDAIRTLGILSEESIDSLRALDSLRTRRLPDAQRAELLERLRDSLRTDSLLGDSTRSRTTLRVFGLDVFRRLSTRFQPRELGPVDEAYRLGPGDELVVLLTGDVELAHQVEVTRDGFVVVPQAGQLPAGGLTLGQFRAALRARLVRSYSGIGRGTTQFDVTVSRLRTIQVYVVGEVLRPGAYQLTATGTVLSALYAAGGPRELGSLRAIGVRRGTKQVAAVDAYEYLLEGVARQDIRLESGDVVVVPPAAGYAKIVGQVGRPAIYERRDGETLQDLVRHAGGLLADASTARIQVHRILAPGERSGVGPVRVVLDVSSDELRSGIVPAVPLARGDSVIVLPVPARSMQFVSVLGSVWVTGRQGFTPGLTLQEALRRAGGLRPEALLDRVLVARLGADSSRRMLRVAVRDSAGRTDEPFVLQDQDEITVVSRLAARPARYVSVTGAVRRPGRIVFRDGMTLRDAVLLSEGITEDAWLREAEIARLPADRKGGELATTLRVPLDSTYLTDRRADGSYLGPPTEPTRGGGAAEVPLHPYDNVLIMRSPEFELQRLVHVTGQVRYPGRYALRSRDERVRDLIERAGGLTAAGAPEALAFFRVSGPQRPREMPTSQPGAAAPAPAGAGAGIGAGASAMRAPLAPGQLPDSLQEQRDLRLRVGIDYVAVGRDARHRDNLLLAAGDSIHVPERSQTVFVRGAVNAPGLVAFAPGRDVEWYVHAAGGFSPRADLRRTYVTQASGRTESVVRRPFPFADSRPLVHSGGSVVTVPERMLMGPSGPSQLPQVLGAIASLVGAIVTVLVVTR
ncbi:MAG: SLBB domain-containing protein [Gemmatimonadales bacterium]|nr:SLBB domain-containing protein [Gemmatimonadales bacterium]